MNPTPKLTAIVSTYAAERFIDGCLADLVAQTIFGDIEVLVIDSGSPEDERSTVERYARDHPNIRYVRTSREPLYVAWNRAIGMARGEYLSNANTDDRHHPRYFEVAVAALEAHPQAALVYANQYRSTIANETFAECQRIGRLLRRSPPYSASKLIERCIAGSQPVWRRNVHNSLGLFDTTYKIAADYDMWLRIAERHPLMHIPETLGVFYESPETLSGAANQRLLDSENLRLKLHYMAKPFWNSQPNARTLVAQGLFSAGYRYIEKLGDPASAKPLIAGAIRINPTQLAFWKTYALRCLFTKHAGLVRP